MCKDVLPFGKNFFVYQIFAISFVISFTVLGPAAFNCSFMTPSSPDVLLFLSLLISLAISTSSGAQESEVGRA